MIQQFEGTVIAAMCYSAACFLPAMGSIEGTVIIPVQNDKPVGVVESIERYGP